MRSRSWAVELKNSSTRTLFLVDEDEDEDEAPIERDCDVFIVWARSMMQMKRAYGVCERNVMRHILLSEKYAPAA